jgi:hypothetical protein
MKINDNKANIPFHIQLKITADLPFGRASYLLLPLNNLGVKVVSGNHNSMCNPYPSRIVFSTQNDQFIKFFFHQLNSLLS